LTTCNTIYSWIGVFNQYFFFLRSKAFANIPDWNQPIFAINTFSKILICLSSLFRWYYLTSFKNISFCYIAFILFKDGRDIYFMGEVFWCLSEKWNQNLEWVSDCCLTPTQQFLQLYYGENNVNFQCDDDDEACCVLDQHSKLVFIASWLKHQSVYRHGSQLWHINLTLSQPVFTLSS
jgi:hypothetical protein